MTYMNINTRMDKEDTTIENMLNSASHGVINTQAKQNFIPMPDIPRWFGRNLFARFEESPSTTTESMIKSVNV